jgi:hypothetical protein
MQKGVSFVFEIILDDVMVCRKYFDYLFFLFFSFLLKVSLFSFVCVCRYAEMIEELSQMGKYLPRTELPPLEVAVSKRVKAYVEEKYKEAGVAEGDFLVFHGIECDSSASMTSKGDTDSLLPIRMWAEIAKSTRYVDFLGYYF